MPNILFDNTCNLRCPYCFSDITREEDKQWLTAENLDKFLNWAKDDGYFGVIGGEPTLHPQFNILLKYIYNFQHKNLLANLLSNELPSTISVFTNGILLGDWFEKDPELLTLYNVYYLINFNELPEYQTKKIDKTLQIAQNNNILDHFSLGCNLYDHKDIEYKWYWDMIEKYNIQKLRVSVTSPANLFANWRNNRFAYFEQMKPHFIHFLEEVKRHHLSLNLVDCGYIPMCMFNDKEQELVQQFVYDTHNTCGAVVDVSPNLNCIACFGSCSEIKRMEDFPTFNDALTYFRQQQEKKRIANLDNDKCRNCTEAQNNNCQGGCLCFSGME